jgi:hypothetical protein
MLENAHRRSRARSRAVRLGASLGIAIFLVLAPAQAHFSHAYYIVDRHNTATGTGALSSLNGEKSHDDTADGWYALQLNASGYDNTAVGSSTLQANNNPPGGADYQSSHNTAVGFWAMNRNTTGSSNTAVGDSALSFNLQGFDDTALGADAMSFSTTGGSANTAVGFLALAGGPNQKSDGITALGYGAGSSLPGTNSLNDTFLGVNTGTLASNLQYATAVGANALVGESNALVLGGTGPLAVQVGIGTQTPHSSLQVVGNYVQLPTVSGKAPPMADCHTAADYGRMVVRTDGSGKLYICIASGWVSK